MTPAIEADTGSIFHNEIIVVRKLLINVVVRRQLHLIPSAFDCRTERRSASLLRAASRTFRVSRVLDRNRIARLAFGVGWHMNPLLAIADGA
jgi:hypothetical protein